MTKLTMGASLLAAATLVGVAAYVENAPQEGCNPGWVWDGTGCVPEVHPLQAMLNDVPQPQHHVSSPSLVTIPPGTYHITETLVVPRPTALMAHGVVIRAAAGIVAMRIGPDADWSRLEGLTLVGDRKAPDDASVGLLVHAHGATIRDVTVDRFNRGILVDGTGDTGANANGVQIDRVRIWNARVGLRLQGADANGGTITGADFNACWRSVEDASFLGNTFIGTTVHPQPQRQTPPAILVSNQNASSVFVGTYIEGGGGIHTESRRSLFLGGLALRHVSGRGEWIGERRGRLTFGDAPTEVMVGYEPEIPFRWTYIDAHGRTMRWSIRRWPDGLWCITRGSRAQCAVTWRDPPP